MSQLPIFAFNEKLLDAVTVGAARTSSAYDVAEASNISLHVVYSGTLSATVTIQGSNDGTNFADVTSTGTISTGAGNVMVSLSAIGFRYARANINYTSGSATVTARLSGKR